MESTSQEQSQIPLYEFTQAQNETIRLLAGRLKFVGIFNVVLGVLYGLIGGRGFIANPIVLTLSIPPAVFFVLVGLLTMSAAKSFSNIVETDGQDIPFLMKALEELQKLYNLQFWLMLIAITMLFIAVLIGVIAGASLGLF